MQTYMLLFFNVFFYNDFAQMFLEFASTAPLFSSLASAPVKLVALGRVFRRWFGLDSRSRLVLLLLLLDSLS
jgi:hypothetical protein